MVIKQFTKYSSEGTPAVGILLMVIIFLLYWFLVIRIRRPELVWNPIEYGQMLFMLCFLPLQLPPSIESFLYGFKSLHWKYQIITPDP